MNPRSVAALLLSRQMPSANSTTAAYGVWLSWNHTSNIVTNYDKKNQYFLLKFLLKCMGFFASPFKEPQAEYNLYHG